jgi:hypothetical protein
VGYSPEWWQYITAPLFVIGGVVGVIQGFRKFGNFDVPTPTGPGNWMPFGVVLFFFGGGFLAALPLYLLVQWFK